MRELPEARSRIGSQRNEVELRRELQAAVLRARAHRVASFPPLAASVVAERRLLRLRDARCQRFESSSNLLELRVPQAVAAILDLQSSAEVRGFFQLPNLGVEAV